MPQMTAMFYPPFTVPLSVLLMIQPLTLTLFEQQLLGGLGFGTAYAGTAYYINVRGRTWLQDRGSGL